MITSEMCCDAVSHVHLESPILKFADLLGETWFVSHRYKITSAAKDFAAWLHLCETSKNSTNRTGQRWETSADGTKCKPVNTLFAKINGFH